MGHKTIEFYNEDEEFEGAIYVKDTVLMGQLQDDIWKLLDDAGCIAYEEEE